MLNNNYFIKMRIYKNAFRRRNLFLYKTFKVDKVNKADEASKTNETNN